MLLMAYMDRSVPSAKNCHKNNTQAVPMTVKVVADMTSVSGSSLRRCTVGLGAFTELSGGLTSTLPGVSLVDLLAAVLSAAIACSSLFHMSCSVNLSQFRSIGAPSKLCRSDRPALCSSVLLDSTMPMPEAGVGRLDGSEVVADPAGED